MNKNKVTMRDIADACGVSVATVSYVLNHSEKEKISHDTRLKIVKTAADMHYIPCIMSQKPAKRKSGLVGIIINLKDSGNSAGKKMMYYDLAVELSRRVRTMGFETLLMPTENLEKDVGVIASHRLDAVFIIDINDNTARKITRDYYVPVIFLDCEINDQLFCKIYPNYPALFQKAKGILNTDAPFLMMEDICNQNLKQRITEWFQSKDVFVNVPGTDYKPFLQSHCKSKGIVLGDFLGLQVEQLFDSRSLVIVSNMEKVCQTSDSPVIFVRNRSKAAAAAEALKNMLCLDYKPTEGNRILLEYEL